jgi:hypothetical protein
LNITAALVVLWRLWPTMARYRPLAGFCWNFVFGPTCW